jgi:hypothetical protein
MFRNCYFRVGTGMAAFLVEGKDATISFSGATPQAIVTGAPKYFV